jgi:hypothetical protein
MENKKIKPEKSWKQMNADELRLEFKRCKDDPNYFISNYVKVEHQLLGLIQFNLFPFQEKIINDLENHRFNLLNKFRQAGATTLACGYSLWTAIFKRHKTIAILSMGDRESVEVLARIKLMYDELPPFLRPKIVKGGNSKHVLHFETGSKIKARPAKKTSGRSLAGYLLIIDEAAFIEHINEIWASVYPIISTGGRVLVLSTVNGMGNWYHETYSDALEKKNGFNIIDIDWREHPQYMYNPDYEWLYALLRAKDPDYDVHTFEEVTRKNIGLKRWRQEYEKEFLGTGNTYIDSETLINLHSNVNKEYTIKYNNRMRVWKNPEPYHEYIMGVDVSLGRELDYSSFIIVNCYNGEQVAEFYSNKTPIDDFAKIIATEARIYNTALTLVERNTIGNNLLADLFNIEEYENIWVDEKGDLGLQVTTTNSEVLLADMEEAIRNKKITLNSERVVKELMTFIITESGKPEADENQNDDLVTSLKLAVKGLNEKLDRSPMLITRLTPKNKEPMQFFGSSDGKEFSKKYFNGVSPEDVKWLLS